MSEDMHAIQPHDREEPRGTLMTQPMPAPENDEPEESREQEVEDLGPDYDPEVKERHNR